MAAPLPKFPACCIRCGEGFLSPRRSTPERPVRFCSHACYRAWQANPPVIIECDCCHGKFEVYASRRPKAHRFCSRKCGRRFQAEAEREEQRRLHPPEPSKI